MGRKEGDDWDPIDMANSEVPEGDEVAVVKGAAGAVIVPASLGRRLSGEQLEIVRDLQRAAMVVHEAQLRVDELVEEARAAGVSWAGIAWCVGLSDEGARRRWGEP